MFCSSQAFCDRKSILDGFGDENSENSSAGSNGKSSNQSWLAQVLLWAPNRIMDLIDIFHVDVGVGPAFGAVVRVSKQGQVGYRQMVPLSVRGGLNGRRVPFFIENGSEIGAGPTFLPSSGRNVCSAEVGGAVDILLVGANAGICFDEVIDFVLGVIFIDPQGDDIK